MTGRPLASAVLTREDSKIWLNINLPLKRPAPQPMPSTAYFLADRTDAALMWEAQGLRRLGPGPLMLYGVLCRGWPLGIVRALEALWHPA